MPKKVWTAPKVIEISLAMEINAYVCADGRR
jgi:coenzyme PQQ precursor peptide PqqA